MSADSLDDDFYIEPLNTKRPAEEESVEPKVKKPKKIKQKPNPSTILSDLALKYNQTWMPMSDYSRVKTDYTFQDFMKFLYPDHWKKVFSSKVSIGCPKILYICSSANRCVDVIRLFKPLGNFKVAKLFSKHIKVEEQVKFIQTERFPVAVGTPNRILKLIKDEHFKLSKIEYIILDVSFKDKKDMNIFDLSDVSMDIESLFSVIDPETKIIGY